MQGGKSITTVNELTRRGYVLLGWGSVRRRGMSWGFGSGGVRSSAVV